MTVIDVTVTLKRTGISLMRPRMQFYEGRQGIETVWDDLLRYPDSETLSWWPIKAMMDVVGQDFIRYHNKKRIRQNIYIKGIWPGLQAVDLRHHPFMGVGPDFRRELRIAPDEIDFTMGYWVYAHGRKVLFASSQAESFGFIIESMELAAMLATQHRFIWGIAKPVEPADQRYTQTFLDEVRTGKD